MVESRSLTLLAGLVLVACDREPAPLPPATSTPPAIERSTESGIASIGGIQARRTEVRDVVADLLTARREGDLLTVTIRFRNAGTHSVRVEIPVVGGSHPGLRLSAGGEEWPIARDEKGGLLATQELARTLGAGQSMLWWGSFRAPPPTVGSFDLAMPGVEGPFRDVPITDSR